MSKMNTGHESPKLTVHGGRMSEKHMRDVDRTS
jgi:hypothetical protein